jgi:hypothetical protein
MNTRATHTDTPQSAERRSFVRGIGVLTGVIALGSPLAALLPSRVWAVELGALSSAEAATLLAMIRTIAPHDTLDDAAYALVVKAIDSDGGSTQNRTDLRPVLRVSATVLRRCLRTWCQRLKSIESGAFFRPCASRRLLVLYSNPIAAAHLGFEGEAFSKGGYLLRGFNDLKWLPDVTLADSGPMPFG